MHAKQVLILAAAGLAAAQSTTSSAATSTASTSGTSGCGTQIDQIITSCLGTTQSQLDACAVNDWDCMCEQSNNVLTCYNNCPSDPRRNGVDQQNVSYCNAAKAYGSSASSASMTRTASASGSSGTSMASASASGSDSESTATATDSSNGSSGPSATISSNSQEASSTESTGAASNVVIPSSLLAAIFGLAAIF